MQSVTGSHADKKESALMLGILWLMSALALLVSLFIVDRGGEAGYIYLRAVGILYLSLTIAETNIIPRGVRIGVGCLMLILACDATNPVPENVPLYLCTAFITAHIILSILTYPTSDLIKVTGIRGSAFILVGVVCSALCLAVGLTVDLVGGVGIAKEVSFALIGVPLITLSNGIPVTEKDQLIGSFSCLVPAAGAMYLAGNLESPQVWIILATSIVSASVSTLLCVSSVPNWSASIFKMWNYIASGKTAAFFLIIVLTFANIACVNGVASSVEEQRCDENDVCVAGIGNNRYKSIEEAIPLIMMGLSKGPLVVLVLLPQQSSMGEMNAWAMTTVLVTASLILLGIEGRGRCLWTNTHDCAMTRSQGFISGLSIAAGCAMFCLLRCIYVGYFIPRKVERMLSRMHGLQAPSYCCCTSLECRKGCVPRVRRVIGDRDIGVALAIGALLICLISTSSAYVSLHETYPHPLVAEAEFTKLNEVAEVIATTIHRREGITEDNGTLVREIENDYVSLCYPVTYLSSCNDTIGYQYSTLLNVRSGDLEEYWRTTAWTISGAILAMAFLIVEIMPGSPAVAVSIMAGLLLTAGRIHFSCLLASMNERIDTIGFRLDTSVELNVYIVSTISIVVGLSWGSSIVMSEARRKKEALIVRRETVCPVGVILTVDHKTNSKQRFDEIYDLLDECKKVPYLLQSKILVDWSNNGVPTRATCTWADLGGCGLADGAYVIEDVPEEVVMMAQACSTHVGTISTFKRVEPVRVPVS